MPRQKGIKHENVAKVPIVKTPHLNLFVMYGLIMTWKVKMEEKAERRVPTLNSKLDSL